MKIKPNSKIAKFLSVVLSLLIVLSAFPVYGTVSFAAGENLTIQYLNNGVVQEGVDIRLKADENADESISGTTDKNGVWETSVTWADLAQTFVVYVNDDAKIIEKSAEEMSHLIIDQDERTWSNSVVALESVAIEASATSVLRGESITFTATVKGTPDSYQWYRNGNEINGATSKTYEIDSADLDDGGKYECVAKDASGNSRTSNSITVTVTEEALSDVTLKAYANGEELTASTGRDSVTEIELKVEGLPGDAEVTSAEFYVNDNCDNHSNTELTYSFDVEDGIETYECKVVLTFAEKYAETTVELAAPIQLPLLAQEELVVTVSDNVAYDEASQSYNVTYTPSPKTTFDVTVSGGSGNGEYSFEITEEKNASGTDALAKGVIASYTRYGNENKWKVTVNGAGSFKFEVGKAGDGNHSSAATVVKNVTVAKASVEGFGFENPAPEAITYNTNNNEYTNIIAGDFEDVKYSIESGDCATVDEATGKVTVLKAGTVTVKATLTESKNYQEASAVYTLTVNKAAQTIQFEEKAEKIYYGQAYAKKAEPVAVEGAADGYGYNHDSDAKIVYSIVLPEGETEAIAQVNEDGSLVFVNGKTGTVTVKAELAENDCYEAASAEYTLTVEEYSVENGYSISGDKKPADNDWYKDDITITPTANHLISKSNNLDDSNIWLESIVIDKEGKENGCDVYLKNIETGAISVAYSIADDSLKLDKTAPDSLKVNYKTASWYETVLDTVTLGYYNSAVTFVLEAQDSVSGVKAFVWSFVAEEEGGNSVEETTAEAKESDGVYQSAECTLGDENDLKDFRGKLTFRAIDNAGNEEEYESSYVIVIDNKDTELSISTDVNAVAVVNNEYPFAVADENSAVPIEIYGKEVTVTLSIIEKNFFPERAVVKVNGEDVTSKISWTASGDNHMATMKFDKDGDYNIDLSYECIFGADPANTDIKEIHEASKFISVDKEPSVITVSLSEANFEAESVKYYNKDVTATFSVKEAKFRPSDLTFETVEGFIGLSAENILYLQNSENWSLNQETGEYTASVVFAAEGSDGNYKFAVGYTDVAGNPAEKVESDTFVIDTVIPGLDVSSAEKAESIVDNAYPYGDATEESENPIEIHSKADTVIITVTEKNFFSDRAVIKVNGEDITDNISWTTSAETHTAEIVFDKNGDYEITVKYTDIFEAEDSTEKAEYTASKSVSIDMETPVISITLRDADNVTETAKYYRSDVRVYVKVKEAKFRPADLVIAEAEGFKGIDSADMDYLRNSENWTYNAEKGEYETSFVVEADEIGGDYKFTLNYTDLAGYAAEQAVSELFVIDINKPIINAAYGEASLLDAENNVISSFDVSETDSVTVFDTEKVVVTFTVDEKNFSAEEAKVYISENSEEYKEINFDGEWTTEGSVHTNTVTVDKQGTFKIKLACTDLCTNVSDEFNSPRIIIDDTVPSVTYKIETEGTYYYDGETVDITINVFDDRFSAGRMSLDIYSRTIDNDKVISITETIPEISDSSNWVENTNESGIIYHSFKLTLSTEAVYTLTTTYIDAVGGENAADCEFVIDRTGPENLEIKYSVPKLYKLLSAITFNYYNAPVTITLTAVDDISGVKKIDWKYTKEAGASDINLESSEGSYEYEVAVKNGEYKVILPVTSDDGTVTLADLEQLRGNISLIVTDAAGNVSKFGKEDDASNENGTDKDTTIVVDTISPTRKVEFSEPTVQANDKLYYDHSAVATVTITEANFYAEDVKLTINGAEYKNLEWTQDGDSWTAIITLSQDGDYVIGITYTDRSSNEMEAYTSKVIVVDTTKPVITSDINEPQPFEFYDVANLGVKFTVVEANFEAFLLTLDITATDINLNPTEVSPEFGEYFKNNANWTHSADNLTHEIIVKSLEEVNLEDGIYQMTIEGKDIVGNEAVTYTTPKFIIDRSSPVDYSITYSTPKLSKLISAVTFNYYNAPVVVTLTATDSVSTVERFEWAYTREKNASTTNVANESGVYEFSMSEHIPFDEEGNIIFEELKGTATAEIRLPVSSKEQYRGNFSFKATDRAGNIGDIFTDAKTVIVVDTVAPTRTVDFSEPKEGSFEEGGKAYYDSDATATITITEANFYPEDVDLKVNDEAYTDVNWTKAGDVWTGIVNFTNDGHYVLKLNYTDRSTNKMEEYVSGEIIIDQYDPVIEVTYAPDKAVYTSGERKYYNEDQTATIKITEHNFDPSKVEVTLTAADIDGKTIDANDLVSQLTSEAAWETDGDVHTATVKYAKDANYTFSISCTDPSGRKSADYTPDEFTVDKTAPTEFSVDVKTKSVYSNDTTEFFNTPVVVNVSAKDAVSGISEFIYSYTDSITGKTQTGNAVATSTGGSGASATFKLPSETGEFKGTVKVVAIDNSGNKSNEYDNKKVVVVDSTAPVGRIELSAPVSTNGGISYYSGNVSARITIDEANFFGEDVAVLVNGNRVASDNWTNSGDSWTTDVVVSADGEYQMSVEYADKSGNQMVGVQSDKFMIDHTAPVIVVSGIKIESANNGEKIGFTLRAEDNNFVADGFAPTLEVVKKSNDGFVKEAVDLSSAIASGNGYSIVIDNLTEDGIYTLTCVASDLCGNTSKIMTVTDSNSAQTEALRFSVNRNGSAYMLDSGSEETVKKQYTQNVNGDIVITEVNVSPITEYSVKLNGTELVEGTDYTVQKSGGGDEWYKNTYTVKANLFSEENEYNIVINSVDETSASYYSDIKGAEIKFVVDNSAPSVTVSGVEANGEYQAEKRLVSIIPTDDGGSLQMMRIVTEDNNGKLLSELFNAEGEALEAALAESNGMIELEIGEGINQTLRIICVDKAGNEYDSADEFSGIRISSSRIALLLTSTGFRVGVGAAAAIAIGFIIFVIIKKKKKDKSK